LAYGPSLRLPLLLPGRRAELSGRPSWRRWSAPSWRPPPCSSAACCWSQLGRHLGPAPHPLQCTALDWVHQVPAAAHRRPARRHHQAHRRRQLQGRGDQEQIPWLQAGADQGSTSPGAVQCSLAVAVHPPLAREKSEPEGDIRMAKAGAHVVDIYCHCNPFVLLVKINSINVQLLNPAKLAIQ